MNTDVIILNDHEDYEVFNWLSSEKILLELKKYFFTVFLEGFSERYGKKDLIK